MPSVKGRAIVPEHSTDASIASVASVLETSVEINAPVIDIVTEINTRFIVKVGHANIPSFSDGALAGNSMPFTVSTAVQTGVGD